MFEHEVSARKRNRLRALHMLTSAVVGLHGARIGLGKYLPTLLAMIRRDRMRRERRDHTQNLCRDDPCPSYMFTGRTSLSSPQLYGYGRSLAQSVLVVLNNIMTQIRAQAKLQNLNYSVCVLYVCRTPRTSQAELVATRSTVYL